MGGQGLTVQFNFLYGGSLEVASECPLMGSDRLIAVSRTKAPL